MNERNGEYISIAHDTV